MGYVDNQMIYFSAFNLKVPLCYYAKETDVYITVDKL